MGAHGVTETHLLLVQTGHPCFSEGSDRGKTLTLGKKVRVDGTTETHPFLLESKCPQFTEGRPRRTASTQGNDQGRWVCRKEPSLFVEPG